DDDEWNRETNPWVWSEQLGKYVESPEAEDSVLLSFEAGCEWNPSLLGGYVYDFDGWHWLAGRSDPLGQAVDLYGSVQDSERKHLSYVEYESRVASNSWNLKFVENNDVDLHADWDQLDRVYMLQPDVRQVYYRAVPDGRTPPPFYRQSTAPEGTPYPRDASKHVPQFSPVRLNDGAGEVSAKGQWKDGYWTVEFRRARVTPAGTLNDTVFQRLTQFSVHVFDRTEAVDQSSESGRLFLRFLPEGDALADQQKDLDSLAER
ncbi:MAG: hypothetical protein HUJ31_04595, partial [Pseudomonadales bacterium]|nr:hypothetical protein [Pseudomonadales bacterium]